MFVFSLFSFRGLLKKNRRFLFRNFFRFGVEFEFEIRMIQKTQVGQLSPPKKRPPGTRKNKPFNFENGFSNCWILTTIWSKIKIPGIIWPNGIIFHQPRFPWNSRGFPLLNHHGGYRLKQALIDIDVSDACGAKVGFWEALINEKKVIYMLPRPPFSPNLFKNPIESSISLRCQL